MSDIDTEGSRWRRNRLSLEPSPDALASYEEKADRLRLMEAMPVKPISERDRLYVLRVLRVLLFVVVVGQRILVPIGSFPISLSLVAAFVGIGLLRLRRGIQYNRVRSELYIAAGAVIVGCAWFTTWSGNNISVNSLLLLLVIYLPWVFCVSNQFLDLVMPVLRFFVLLMVTIAIVGAAQMVAQVVLGWQYQDFLAELVSPTWLEQGYNTANEISFTNPILKANAFVFLEPSFLSQFCALALIVSLLIRAPAWQPLVLGIGMAATLSGTGILLLVLGISMLFVLVPNRIRPSYLIAGIVGLAIVFSTPAADILLDRRSETSQSGSSGSLRFVQPYTEVSKGLAEEPSRYVVGAGPGASDRLLESSAKDGQGEAVVYAIAPKLAFEYGLVGAVLFVAFLLVSILRGPPLPVLPTSVVFMIFFLSGSLLQPHTVILAWLLTSIWGKPVTIGVSDTLAARMSRQRNSTITVITDPDRQNA